MASKQQIKFDIFNEQEEGGAAGQTASATDYTKKTVLDNVRLLLSIHMLTCLG